MSTPKKMLFEEEARKALRDGIKKLTDVVACTMGPKGRHVGLAASFGSPHISNQGNEILKKIVLEDDFENIGVSMAKDMAQKLSDKCGDGTTTALLLLDTLIQEGFKCISAGACAVLIKKGLEKGCDALVKELYAQSSPLQEEDDVAYLATASASGDQEVGKILSDALKKATKEGTTLIEEGKGTETTLEFREGMELESGYLSPYFCTNTEKMIVEMENPAILLIDKKISSIHEILPLLQSIASASKELLIIADDIEGDALSALVLNKIRGTLKVTAAKAPGFGEKKKEFLEDIAALTGATVLSEEKGMDIKHSAEITLGSAEKVVMKKDSTLIIKGAGNPERIKMRLQSIDAALKDSPSDDEKEGLEKRRAKLSSGIVVISVGAETEFNLKQKKQKFENALRATQAALEEGIIVGGGISFLRTLPALDTLSLEGDEELGVQILRKACARPLMQLACNAGLNPAVVLSDVLKCNPAYGLNVQTLKIENLYEKEIIDPVKTVVNALIYAVSQAKIALITSVLITEDN